MVAESGSNIVGFMNITCQYEAETLCSLYQLEDFSNFAKCTSRLKIDDPTNIENLWNKQSGDSIINKTNAMCIRIFCIDKDYAPNAFQFVEYAYKNFPDIDFCLLGVPQSLPEISLCNEFVKVKTRTAVNDMYTIANAVISSTFPTAISIPP